MTTTWEGVFALLLSSQTIELNGETIVVRLPGRTLASKHQELMLALAGLGLHPRSKACNPILWAIAMGGSVLVGPRDDVLVFLDSSTIYLPLSQDESNDKESFHDSDTSRTLLRSSSRRANHL